MPSWRSTVCWRLEHAIVRNMPPNSMPSYLSPFKLCGSS
jgi:hypothetical protein